MAAYSPSVLSGLVTSEREVFTRSVENPAVAGNGMSKSTVDPDPKTPSPNAPRGFAFWAPAAETHAPTFAFAACAPSLTARIG